MKANRRFLTVVLASIVTAMLASISLAGPGSSDGAERGQNATLADGEEGCEDPVEGEESVEGEEPVEGDEPDCETDDPKEGDDSEEEEENGPDEGEDGSPAERMATCMAAAGIDPTGDDGADADAIGPHGLDNAIEHVLANCVKNPQAPGLLNALTRLAANRERHEEHRAWLAERKAEREAAKAERKADKGAGHGNGGGNEHGNPRGAGSNGSNGNGHGRGNGGSHGNGHH